MYDFDSLPHFGGARMPKLSSPIYAQVKIHIRNARSECRAKLEINTMLTHTQRIELAAQIEAYKNVLAIFDAAEEAEEIQAMKARKVTANDHRSQAEKFAENIGGWFTASDVEKMTNMNLSQAKTQLNALWQIGKLKKRSFSRNITASVGLIDQYCYRHPVDDTSDSSDNGTNTREPLESIDRDVRNG